MPAVIINFFNNHTRAIKATIKNAKKTNVPTFPPEIIRMILACLKDDKKALAACALVNYTFNLHVTPILYHTVSFSFPCTFTRFSNVTKGVSDRTRLIRHLDLSGFSTFGLQKSQVATHDVVTPQCLINILKACPNLEAFSVSESLESTITLEVLTALVFGCRNLKALDFCGCTSKEFSAAMNGLAATLGHVQLVQYADASPDEAEYGFQRVQPKLARIERLSLHECPGLSGYKTILTLLAHMPNLTHLDLGGCSISDITLQFLETETNAPTTLSHLSVAKCKNISSDSIAQLITQCTQLEYLNLYGDRDIAMTISEWDLVTIISSPSAKRLHTLDIGSTHITPRVLYAIQSHCSTSLKNLGLANAAINTLSNITSFLAAMPNLQYIDLTNVPCFSMLNTNTVFTKINKDPKCQLHTIEMSEKLLKKLHAIEGWKIEEPNGRRCYYSKEVRTGMVKPDRVHERKIDVTQCGADRMSKIFQYYSYGV